MHCESYPDSHIVDPSGKPMIQHLLRCQGIGVKDYSLTLDALHLQHPRLLQRYRGDSPAKKAIG
jgi:hypothetical protein